MSYTVRKAPGGGSSLGTQPSFLTLFLWGKHSSCCKELTYDYNLWKIKSLESWKYQKMFHK